MVDGNSGHEQEDVVKYRKRTNDGKKYGWYLNGQAELRMKGQGRDPIQENHKGYWDAEQLVKQVEEKFIPASEAAHAGSDQALVMFDNSSNHGTFAKDTLIATNMNLNSDTITGINRNDLKKYCLEVATNKKIWYISLRSEEELYGWQKKSGWKLESKTARNQRKVKERAAKKKAEEAEKNRQMATCHADLEKAAALMKEAESLKKGVAMEEAAVRLDDAKNGKKDKKAEKGEKAADMERLTLRYLLDPDNYENFRKNQNNESYEAAKLVNRAYGRRVCPFSHVKELYMETRKLWFDTREALERHTGGGDGEDIDVDGEDLGEEADDVGIPAEHGLQRKRAKEVLCARKKLRGRMLDFYDGPLWELVEKATSSGTVHDLEHEVNFTSTNFTIRTV
ncbi:hypothetical protein BT69DRAFT_1401522 [Atractiella rhizophila]|nr:hypothetical protein BT69DRAFT_1401522 [Atractiella rhizophila]